jgi:long-subunit fatty acid transport protein
MAGGIKVKLATPWTFAAGLGYDGSAVKDQCRPVAVPMGGTCRFGLGVRSWQF